jgi:hypothetical protein
MFAVFAALLASLVEFLFGVAILAIVYQIFFADWFKAKKLKRQQQVDQSTSMEKIAQLKLIADDPKEIENFITSNAAGLSTEMVARLVARIEILKNDQVIDTDTILKRRIDALKTQEEIEDDEVYQDHNKRTM